MSNSIAAPFEPYLAQFNGYTEEGKPALMQGWVLGIWDSHGSPEYLVETTTSDGWQYLRVLDTVKALPKPAR